MKNPVLVALLLISAALIVLVEKHLAPSWAVVVILGREFIITGLRSVAATEGVIKAWITNLAHNQNTATAIGFYTSCESICALLASIIAGALWTNFGSTSTFATTAIIATVVSIYFLLKVKSKQS